MKGPKDWDWECINIGAVIDYNGNIYQITEKKAGGVMAELIKSNNDFNLKSVAITYAWLKHNLETVYSKEENPEYFL